MTPGAYWEEMRSARDAAAVEEKARRRFCYGETHVWLKTERMIAPQERCTCGQRAWGNGAEEE